VLAVKKRNSGAEVGRSGSVIYTMRGGKIIRIEHVANLDEGLDLLGLSEQHARPQS
jgi:hypothetical protein